MVAGSSALMSSLTVWKTRYAGDLYTAFPQAISALHGLDTQPPQMANYVRRARDLAQRLCRA
jgi:hypothetical protein